MKRHKGIVKKLICAIFLTSMLCPALSVFGQAGSKKPSTPTCSGAWTGNITFTRTQVKTDTTVTPRVSGRGKDTKDFQLKYDYKASVAVIEDPAKNGSSIAKASINSNYILTDKTLAEESNSCDKGKTFRIMTGNFTNKVEISGSGTGEANVSIGVNSDGTYTVGVGLPQIPGKTTSMESATYSNQCSPKEGFNRAMPETPSNVQGASFRSNGTHRVDPNNPNRLSGSYSETALGITNTITWSLQKCGASLRISDMKFEDMKFPNWNNWQEIIAEKGTIDGNFVKITVKVLNTSGETKFADLSFKEIFKGDKWDGARPDMPLKNDYIGVKVDPGEEREVEYVWDSSGYAWFNDGRPRLLQRIKADIFSENKLLDSMTKNLKIAPKPVVLVHGLWSTWEEWNTWQNIFTISHSYDWKAFPVGEKPEYGVMKTGGSFLSTEPTDTIEENAVKVERYVKYAQLDRNAWHVDMVAHSIGGLISRYYIDRIMQNYTEDPRPRVAHLLMLGTPNMGSPCADVMDIAFASIERESQALRQMQPAFVANFNKIHTQRKGVKFSALAGNPFPIMCKELVWNDGAVSVPSAKWIIKDTAESKNIHSDLTGTEDFTNFVKPRLAIGPKGNHNPEMPDIPKTLGQHYQQNNAVMFMNAKWSETSAVADGSDKPDFAKAVKLSPKQSIEIEIPVEQAKNFGLTFMADSQISATLFNEKGEIVGKNLTKTPEASGWFRSIFYDKPTVSSTWKLRLENTGDGEYRVALATWKDAVK